MNFQKNSWLWKYIGSFITIFAATIYANEKQHIYISPEFEEVDHYVNESHIVTCGSESTGKFRWLNPNGENISNKRGRVHVEEMSNGLILALVFEQIRMADRGNWTCVLEDSEVGLSFKMIINDPISFLDTPTTQNAMQMKDANIRCEVKGNPEPKISWYFNGQPILLPHYKYIKLADGLLIKNVSKSDRGEYTCKAFQFSSSISNVKEQTIWLNIQYMPFWKNTTQNPESAFGYMNGIVNLTCKAEAEPVANFTWYRHGKRVNENIFEGQYSSILQLVINDLNVFGEYKCHASNSLGSIERTITLHEGSKPDPPEHFILRGVNSDTFDIDVGASRTSKLVTDKDLTGFRFELIPQEEYKSNGGSWQTAKVLDFGFEDGITYLINHLPSNTTFFVRVASRNIAGLSDFTETKIFTTHPKEPMHMTSASSNIAKISFNFLLSVYLIATTAFFSQFLSSVFRLKNPYAIKNINCK